MSAARAQTTVVVENFEFATSDAAAAAGVTDLTDPPNQPTFYINGALDKASPNEPAGHFSIGTDAVYCLDFQYPCTPGTFIGFRRGVDPARFPLVCAGNEHYAPLSHTYGDPDHPGPVLPDYPLSQLAPLWDVYGDGGFADGLTGTHLWLRLVDCEGEKYEFINYSEVALYSEIWSFDVPQGEGLIRLAPGSLTEVPNGDRLLTEVAAIEVLIQDTDSPPTTFGKWYVDYLRLVEPAAARPGDWDGDGDVDLLDYAALTPCLAGPSSPYGAGCAPFDDDQDGDVDARDFGLFQTVFGVAP